MNIRVVRSCYALSETNIPIVTIQNLSPGESYTFTDDATPAWQYGYQYTYNAYASIGNEEGYAGYGSMNPGIPFAFGNNAVSATSVAKDDSFIV